MPVKQSYFASSQVRSIFHFDGLTRRELKMSLNCDTNANSYGNADSNKNSMSDCVRRRRLVRNAIKLKTRPGDPISSAPVKIPAAAAPAIQQAAVGPWVPVGLHDKGIKGEKCGPEYATEDQVREAFAAGTHLGYFKAHGELVNIPFQGATVR